MKDIAPKSHKPALTLHLGLLLFGCAHADEASSNRCVAPTLTELAVLAPGVKLEQPFRIHGKGFAWDHEVRVALPASYGTGESAYPVLWVTDGIINFELAVEAVNGPWSKYLPEMIVVGVGGPPEASAEFQARRTYEFTLTERLMADGPRDRVADLAYKNAQQLAIEAAKDAGKSPPKTGGAPEFLRFLVDELRPMMRKKYRMSGTHALFGHSGGGFFCAYAFLARPRSFKQYICLSPNLSGSDYELFRLEEKLAADQKDLAATVYLAAGEGEILQGGYISEIGIVSSMSRMAETLRSRSYPSLKLYVHIFANEEHGTYKPSGLAHGLQSIWGKPITPRQSATQHSLPQDSGIPARHGSFRFQTDRRSICSD